MPRTRDLLNRYEAAVLLRMSPKLLNWLARYAPKKGEDRKLCCVKQEGEVYFTVAELRAFDRCLSLPWPKDETATRPLVPAGIEAEIKEECSRKCVICGESVGEIAHIDPVHQSRQSRLISATGPSIALSVREQAGRVRGRPLLFFNGV